jgi:glycosyltransferase involved in cell wall biosynthesis
MTAKRVYIIGSKGPYSLGGYETTVRCLGDELQDLGYDVYVTSESSPADDHRLNPRFKVVHLFKEPRQIGPMGRIFYDLYSALLAVRNGADVVYMLGYNAAWVLVLPLLMRKAVFVNSDGVEWARPSWGKSSLKRAYLQLNERLMKWLPMRVISDSREIEKFQEKRLNLASTFIPYGGDSFRDARPEDETGILDGYGLASGDYYFISVRVVEDNYIDSLIAAFRNSRSRLVLIGSIPDTAYGKKVEGLLHDAVTVLDLTSMNPDYNVIRRHAKANIHSHRFGGTSPNLLEVMALQVPIIAFDTPYSREVVGANALFYNSAETLVDRISEFEATPPATVEGWVSGNSERIEQLYNWKTVARMHAEAFEAALQR